ncbi:unnamed protein product, partial [marine sediment metagenome]
MFGKHHNPFLIRSTFPTEKKVVAIQWNSRSQSLFNQIYVSDIGLVGSGVFAYFVA